MLDLIYPTPTVGHTLTEAELSEHIRTTHPHGARYREAVVKGGQRRVLVTLDDGRVYSQGTDGNFYYTIPNGEPRQ